MRDENDPLIRLVRDREPGLSLEQANAVAAEWRQLYGEGFTQLGIFGALARDGLDTERSVEQVALTLLQVLAHGEKADAARRVLAVLPDLQQRITAATTPPLNRDTLTELTDYLHQLGLAVA